MLIVFARIVMSPCSFPSQEKYAVADLQNPPSKIFHRCALMVAIDDRFIQAEPVSRFEFKINSEATILKRSTPWLRCRPTDGPPRMRLFCLPHAGGGSIAFQRWSATLPASVQVCSVMLPGRETRISEPLFTEIDPLLDAMTDELCPWLDTPYAIFGHSMGALLAFEWVRRLRQEERTLPQWLFLSGRRSPDVPDNATTLHLLSDRDFVEELTRRFDGIPPEILQNDEHMSIYLPILRADVSVVESYSYYEGEPLDCPITLFYGVDDRSVTWDQMVAWKRHTKRQCTFQFFPGGHFYPQQPLLQVISATLHTLNPC